MADEVRADPDAIVRLAKATLAGADTMTDGWSAAQGVVVPPGDAYGNSSAGPAIAAAAAGAEAAMDATWRRIVGVYEGDVDRLFRVAFAYQQADSEAAERQRRTAGGRQPI
ncbi:hypothetical protein AB0368_34375 [Actinoplanes sp. NPDC051475]|uniref:hypothetical protein n=1 Tax=Actinoplanes sp. NPDC051475 TaxID=3157225 RepID=UPI00344D3178